MEYPQDFSPQAIARVEAERLKAGKELEEQRNEVPWSRYGPVRADEENLRKYILRVFLVFAQELCKLGSQRQWTVDRLRSAAYEFLRRLVIGAYSDEGHDKQGRKLPEMTDNYGNIKEKVRWAFKKSAEWQQFKQELLAVAEQQARLHQLEAKAMERTDSQPSAPKTRVFTHSSDYRSVTVRDENFTLTSRQAQVIQILDESRQDGHPDVGKDYLLEQLGSPNSRLRDSFKTNPRAWETLVKIGAKRATYRLNV